ncbi:hypothetical protein PIB30_059444 [Stylosanthes scabra]|uniref:Putative plant transposon protein domain-containing protein n=1 Tax=Stylosanthes scabra TaxID=79078 RepID=A0ABU6WK60_9FABA|nr:hypothetical protein [Stylosanthes scabra]
MRGNHPSLPSPLPLTYPSQLPCPTRICIIPTHMCGNLTLSPIQSICYPSTTHMRAFLRICVGHTHSHPTLHLTQPAHSFPKHSLSPRLCVQSYAYAWHTHSPSPLKTHSTNPSHVLNPLSPTHMRTTLRICVDLTPHTQSHSLLAQNTPHHPRICVQLYAYAWNPRTCITPSSPHRACPRIDHFYARRNGRSWRARIQKLRKGYAVDFSPGNIQTVMRFRTQVQGVATDFETRKEHGQQLDQVLADLCMPGATWKLSTGQLRVPIRLRRQELNPVARGWHEFSIHSLIPSSNRSEIPVIRAILIHCIMRGEDVRAEDIIADKIVRMAQGIKEKGKLGFPSTIYKLCKEAGVPLREFRRTRKIQAEKPITARRIESTRLPRPVQQRQQEDEEEDHPMPQAEEGNKEGNEKHGYDHDYHHQPDFEQQQPEYEQHQDFNEPPVQQPPLYHIPTYTDQHQKDLDSIETQLQNMM